MANTKISALTDGGAPQAGDNVPAVRSGANIKTQLGTMAGQSASAVAITGGTAKLTSVDTQTSPSGSVELGTFPAAPLKAYTETTPASTSSNVTAAIVGYNTHKGASTTGNQHNLGVLGVTNNEAPAGSNLTTNGTFAADASWTKGTGWTISGGVANASAGSATALSQVIGGLVTSSLYELTYTITRSAGTITPSVGGTNGTARSASGTYTEHILCGATTTFAFNKDASFAGTLDNVTLKLAAYVTGAYNVEGRVHHTRGRTGLSACFIAAAQTVTEGAGGFIDVHADFLSNNFSDHAYMYSKYSWYNFDPNKGSVTEGYLNVKGQLQQGGKSVQAATAWCNFDASSGTPTIRNAHNVTSITDNGVGNYTLNYTNALASGYKAAAGGSNGAFCLFDGTNGTTSINMYTYSVSTLTLTDFAQNGVIVQGGIS